MTDLRDFVRAVFARNDVPGPDTLDEPEPDPTGGNIAPKEGTGEPLRRGASDMRELTRRLFGNDNFDL
jgi:hypothetical protein